MRCNTQNAYRLGHRMNSPGEQARPSAPKAGRIVFLLLIAAFLGGFAFAYRGQIEEHRLYFFSERQPLVFDYSELSEDWTERTLQERFKGFPVRCFHDSSAGLGERVCGVDAKSHNGVPVLFMSFFFSSGRLSHVSINVPWWSHSQGQRAIEAALGPPVAAQFLPRRGVRLLGWRLPGGAALFYNRDRGMNPLVWNAIFWKGATACQTSRCFAS